MTRALLILAACVALAAIALVFAVRVDPAELPAPSVPTAAAAIAPHVRRAAPEAITHVDPPPTPGTLPAYSKLHASIPTSPPPYAPMPPAKIEIPASALPVTD